jgi:diadenosine tetraphosphatase ApaH/serine/threonine PP2A family protein phosphatase
VVGDIHGCYDELLALLEKVELKAEDRVVAVGDLIVKGPKNRQVLDLFNTDPRFSSVIGNHDLALLKFWTGESNELNSAQRRTADELETNKQYYLEFLRRLPSFILLGDYAVVHAGVRPGVPLAQQTREDLTSLRTLGPDPTSRTGTPWFEVYEGTPTVLFGHWPASTPRIAKRAIGLDTGCVYGYNLTAYVLETQEFITVSAASAYDKS